MNRHVIRLSTLLLATGMCLGVVGITTVAARVLPEGPTGPYDGPVKVIYAKDNAPEAPKLEDFELTDTVSQYGITWKFDREVRAGRFITGDWYFVGPASVVAITPKPLFGEEVVKHPDWKLINQGAVKEDRYKAKWARNGSTLNQRIDTIRGGYDSRLSHNHYDPEQLTQLPIRMTPGDSLISTISTPDPIDYRGYGQPVMAAAVLTCMNAPQPADAFRPSYCDKGNKVYLARNLRRGLLYSLPRTKAAPKDLSEWARVFQRPWLDTVAWGYANPKENTPRYGRWITKGVSQAALLLHLDYPAEQKEQLLIGYVQYGIDLWGIVRAGYRGWPGHGGFGGGRKWSIIFAGIMLGDQDMRSPNAKYPNCRFGEDDQTSKGKSWTGHDVLFESHPNWRKVPTESKPPRQWETMQSEAYRRCCTSAEWPGQALAAHLMRAEKDWNHDPFFAYVDRWMTEDHAKELIEIREAAKVNDRIKFPNWWNNLIKRYQKPSKKSLFREMWDRYRNNLPPARAATQP